MFAISRKLFLVLMLCCTLACSIFAAERETMYDTEYCFSEADFCNHDMGDVDGIFVTAVPEQTVATIKLGERTICAGDVLNASALENLRLIPHSTENCTATMTYFPIYGQTLAASAEVTIKIQNGKNDAPKAHNVEFETYKNIANDGKFNATDPEGGLLTYQIVDAPKQGSVQISDDGTFVYTPEKNKVGEDRFTYTATDDAGNVSKTATVNVRILKPTEKMTFADMTESMDQYEAMWLKECGLYGGRKIGTQVCFCPENSVSRGEFVVMAMEFLNIPGEDADAVSVFADASDIPSWMQPYLGTALRSGYIRGQQTENGLTFRASDPITQQEAAVIMQNMLKFPVTAAVTTTDLPDWSARAVLALSNAGIQIDYSSEALTYRQMATLFHQIDQI